VVQVRHLHPMLTTYSQLTTQDPEPSNVIVGTPSQLDSFIVLALEFMTEGICASTVSQGFFPGLVRKISETARLLFDHCSSPACFATSHERTILLTRIVAAASLLHKRHAGFSGPLCGLPYRLLRFRLDAQPGSGSPLINSFEEDGQSIIPASTADISAALEILRSQSSSEIGQGRLVRVIICPTISKVAVSRSCKGPRCIIYREQYTIL